MAGQATLAEALETSRRLLDRAAADLSEIADMRREARTLSQTDDETAGNG